MCSSDLAGAGFVDLTRAQARARARELVDQGLIAQSQVQALVDGLLEESRRRRDLALTTVRSEVGRQVKALGLVTRADLAAVTTAAYDLPSDAAMAARLEAYLRAKEIQRAELLGEA